MLFRHRSLLSPSSEDSEGKTSLNEFEKNKIQERALHIIRMPGNPLEALFNNEGLNIHLVQSNAYLNGLITLLFPVRYKCNNQYVIQYSAS